MATRLEQTVGSIDLTQRISHIYDHLYANAPVRTPHGICTEVGKLLHAAMWQEETTGRAPAFSFSRSELRSLSNGLGLMTSQTADQIRSWFAAMNAEWQLYPQDEEIILSDSDLRYCAGQLNNIAVADRDRDVFGDALEIFRSQWSKQVGGQFFTDQRVTTLAMQLLDFDPRTGDDLVDICAGTAGFLLAGLNHIQQLVEDEAEVVALARASLRGQEVDSQVADIANATLSARLGDRANSVVNIGDSLRYLSSSIGEGRHRCIATNPPFGTKITVKDPEVLNRYTLAKLDQKATVKSTVSPKAPDILFLERNLQLLKPGVGRMAIVVPYQILSGPQTYFVRHWLLTQAEVQAVVDLPSVTFQPHTGTKTSLVLLRRRSEVLSNPSESPDTPVFFSMPQWIGHDRRGNPVYVRDIHGNPTTQLLSDFEAVGAGWAAFQRGQSPLDHHEYSWIGSSAAITNDPLLRFNALFHAPAKDYSSSDASCVRLGDVVNRVFYPGRFKRHYVPASQEAVPFLGGTNISQLLVTTDKWLPSTERHFEQLIVHAGWILITRSGSTGIVSSVPAAWDGYAISEHVIRIVPDETKLPSAYLQAYLRSPSGQAQLSKGVFGSVIDEISPEFVADLTIPVPKPELLAAIVGRMARAEAARQEAIVQFESAIADVPG